MRQRGMMIGRKHETNPRALDAAGDLRGRQAELHAEGGKYVGGTTAR